MGRKFFYATSGFAAKDCDAANLDDRHRGTGEQENRTSPARSQNSIEAGFRPHVYAAPQIAQLEAGRLLAGRVRRRCHQEQPRPQALLGLRWRKTERCRRRRCFCHIGARKEPSGIVARNADGAVSCVSRWCEGKEFGRFGDLAGRMAESGSSRSMCRPGRRG